jgi:PAS domain S-box-containing protein
MTFSVQQAMLIFAAIFSLLLALHVLVLKQVRAILPLICVLMACILWSSGAAAALFSETVQTKVIFYKISQTGEIWLPLAWVIFIWNFIHKDRWNNPKRILAISAVPIAAAVFMWTNELHLWYWQNISIAPFLKLQLPEVTLGLIGRANLYYVTVLTGAAMLQLFWTVLFTKGERQRQGIILLLCTVIPFITLTFFMPALNTVNEIIPAVYLYILSIMIFSIGLFRYRLLSAMPIAYQTMIDCMKDGILVLDREQEIIHINQAAALILATTPQAVIGKFAKDALSGQPVLLESCLSSKDNTLQIIQLQTIHADDTFEVMTSSLSDPYGVPVGRMITLHKITQRVKAEKATLQTQERLRQSEEKYRSLVENINEVIFITDNSGTITYVSPIAEQYTGYSPEFIQGKSFHEFVHPEDIPGIEAWHDSLESDQQSIEFRVLDRMGNIRFVRTSIRFIFQDGEIVGRQGVLTDITDRKQANEALEKRASQLDILNKIGEQIAALMELDRVLDSAPHLIQKSFGYYHVGIFTPEHGSREMVMRSTSGAFTQVFPPNHRLKFEQGMVGSAAIQKKEMLSNDVRLDHRYTNMYPEQIQTRSELAVPILIGDEMVGVLDIQSPRVNAFDHNDVLVMKTVADQIAIAIENARLYEEARCQIKEREHRENMLRIQRDLLVHLSSTHNLGEMLQTAAENLAKEIHASRVVISLIDLKSEWVALNAQPAFIDDAGEEAYGMKLAGGKLSVICVPLIYNEKVIGVIKLEGSDDHAFTKDDQQLITILSNSLVVLIERARLFEEVESARSELEKRAGELETANARLRELDRIKSQFLANMSHELRTPLNSIIGFSELMIDCVTGPLNNDQKECIEDIHQSGKHLLALINDLLDFSKIESGRMELNPTKFDVGSLYDEIRINVAVLIGKKEQVLTFENADSLPPLTADSLRIKQVFINLISNANKFTPVGGTIRVSCCMQDPDHLLFSVTDTGIGIRPEDYNLIFEEFRQVDGSMERQVAGTGLGLAISKRIVEMHGGKIWVESAYGSGATFYVQLPVYTHATTLETGS